MNENKYFVIQLRSGNAVILKEGITFTEMKREYPTAKPMFPIMKDWLK